MGHGIIKWTPEFDESKYSVFHRFRQDKFSDNGLILSSKQIFATAPAASKNDARYKSGQNRLQNNHLATSI